MANRSSCGGAWETFQIVNNNDGTGSLKSIANGKYVCAVIDENNQLLPRSESVGTWEKFIIEKISDGEYALYSLANGKYVQANLNDGGKLLLQVKLLPEHGKYLTLTEIKVKLHNN